MEAAEPLPQRVRKRGRKSKSKDEDATGEAAAAEDDGGSDEQEAPAEPAESDNLSSTFASEAEREATLAAAQSIFARPKQYEWGGDMKEAFEQVVVCMFGYMTELESVDIDAAQTRKITAEGHDVLSLLFAFMDEFLFVFSTEDFVCKSLSIIEFDLESFKIVAIGHGEKFSLSKHPQGTEIKAITYSNMQVLNTTPDRVDVYVIVDI